MDVLDRQTLQGGKFSIAVLIVGKYDMILLSVRMRVFVERSGLHPYRADELVFGNLPLRVLVLS